MIDLKDSDVATIEQLHDLILEECILGLDSILLTKSRELSQRIQKYVETKPEEYHD